MVTEFEGDGRQLPVVQYFQIFGRWSPNFWEWAPIRTVFVAGLFQISRTMVTIFLPYGLRGAMRGFIPALK